MKNHMTAIAASLLAASLSFSAFAQQVPPQQQTPPPQQMPQQQQMPPQQQMPQQQQMPPATSAGTTSGASSSAVEHKIKRALTRHGVTATGVTVAFSDGTATLSGTVYTQQDIAKAKKAAMQVSGVTQVDVSGLQAKKGHAKSGQAASSSSSGQG